MRFSATEQIIRDAERQDAGSASSGSASPPMKRAEAAPSSTARDLFKVQQAQAQPEFDVDIDIEDTNGGYDDEGQTLVDTERAAAALQEMRSYGAKRARPPFNDVPARSSGLSARPVGNGFVSAPRPSPPSPFSASPTPTLRWAGGVPPGRPAARPNPPSVTKDSSGNLPTSISSALGEAPAPFDFAQPARRTVGRRMGILIAAATAAAVAVGVGTWTRSGRESPAHTPSVTRPAGAPRAPATAVIVPTAPTPIAVETPPPAPVGSVEASDSAAPVPPPSVVARAKPTPAKVGKARSVRKQIANKARRSKRHAGKVVASRAQRKRSLDVALPAQVPARSFADPDATLPIED